ncbi:MAG: hypothetical protein Q4P08_02540 [Eubacteriales bacterium]|nr:hypothetical protein [Eubacteriales bacterium]
MLKDLLLQCLDREICLICAAKSQGSWRRKLLVDPYPGWSRAQAYPSSRLSSEADLRAHLESNLCPSCLAAWPFRLAAESCLKANAVPEVFVLFPYRAEVKEALLRYKFRLERRWALVLAALSLIELKRFVPEGALLCPVPGTKQRNRQRGFNPPALIVEHLVQTKLYRSAADLLSRELEGPYQHELPNRQARLQNMERGLRVNARALAKYRHEKIYIVDDIVTSGASLIAVERACQSQGLETGLIAIAGGADFYCYERLRSSCHESSQVHF